MGVGEVMIVRKEMSLVRSEFDRQLTRLADRLSLSVQTSGEGYQLRGPGSFCVRMGLLQLPPRQIASIRLPVMQVEIDFVEATAGEVEHFTRLFDLYFRKGGG
ncbi:hypothetical protein [Aestuariirhabdus litorea]|uniref:Uncharacterized protein n=1 Tax=Aestuariirhabdus litorea TaxID=2528527 RepID=A0A3P3VQN9_9GAMM|nr:hypothetical protein [Aestuariirhabdus litorea]RRJ84774.1 hypothetical protein D0544_06650 [Aestuariirhabdus litorea]RWW97998.1 hypothetical protein DZC74_06645 [Endozoicomonadaceae bacterium GTF-13]